MEHWYCGCWVRDRVRWRAPTSAMPAPHEQDSRLVLKQANQENARHAGFGWSSHDVCVVNRGGKG